MYGRERWVIEPSPVKRWGYRLLGQLHVPQRLRTYWILREIRKLGLMQRPIRMLNAGCGRGEIDVLLAKRCPHWRIVGLDLDAERLEICRRVAAHEKLPNLEFHQRDLMQLPYRDEFDLILNADVLEHIEDDRRVLSNFWSALKPGGHLIITSPSVPQRKHLSFVRWRETKMGLQPSDYGHVRDGYSTQDIDARFRETGGETVRAYYTFGFFGTLAFDVFFIIGDNSPNPVVFLLFFPFLMLLAGLDLLLPSKTGSAVLAVGKKPSVQHSEALRVAGVVTQSAG